MSLPRRAVAIATHGLAAAADAETAGAMAKYLKTTMPFYGVKAPVRREIARELYATCAPDSRDDLWSVVDALWQLPHREERYLAVGFGRRFVRLLDVRDLPRVASWIRDAAWWDLVDELAIHVVGPIVRADSPRAWPHVERWNADPDLWLRRTSIICQIGAKDATSQERLFAFCRARAHEREFFIRKAIGWALREYSKTEPDAVVQFVAQQSDHLSGLSRREALRVVARRS